jgi:hypothetical protein
LQATLGKRPLECWTDVAEWVEGSGASSLTVVKTGG